MELKCCLYSHTCQGYNHCAQAKTWGLSNLSREEESVWGDNLECKKFDVKDIEMASVFTQANYMCSEWLMNHYKFQANNLQFALGKRALVYR